MSPSYMPYTIPKVVQTPVSKSSNQSQPFQLPLVAGRYYHSESFRSYAHSCKSEPAIPHATAVDDRLVSRAMPRYKEIRSISQLNGSHKISSRPSSRASSFRSEDFDIERKENVVQNKDVYIHSSLIHSESPDSDDKEGQFVPDDHIVSYDQETDDKDVIITSQKGALAVSLYYDIESSELNVVVKQAINLPLEGSKEEDLDVYVNFCLVPEDFYWQKTMAVLQTRNPVFDQTFQIPDVLHHKLRQYTLCFLVMNSSGFQETLIGKVMIPLSELRGGVEVEMCRELGD